MNPIEPLDKIEILEISDNEIKISDNEMEIEDKSITDEVLEFSQWSQRCTICNDMLWGYDDISNDPRNFKHMVHTKCREEFLANYKPKRLSLHESD